MPAVLIQKFIKTRMLLIPHQQIEIKTERGTDDIGKLPASGMDGKNNHTLAGPKSLLNILLPFYLNILIYIGLTQKGNEEYLYEILAETLIELLSESAHLSRSELIP